MIKKRIFPYTLIAVFIYTVLIFGESYIIDKNGLGIFAKWLIHGYSSLTYQLNLINLLIDFLPFLIIITISLQYKKIQPNRLLEIFIYVFIISILLYIIFNFITYEIYLGAAYNSSD